MDGEKALAGIQIGLNSSDVVGSAQLYADAFGFANAGGTLIWGQPMAIQGLDPTARGLIWWLVGRQAFFQLEIFNHSVPAQRPLPPDWRCSDLGWTRFGVTVSDLARTQRVLADNGIAVKQVPGERGRVAFRDPFIGCFVEVFQDGEEVPGGRRSIARDLDPAIIYATSSVSDLDAARTFYQSVLRLPIEPLGLLHAPAHEAAFGLPGAERDGFVVRAGEMLLEIICYAGPQGRPRPDDYRVTDQGIVNVALGSRDKQAVQTVINRVSALGCTMSSMMTFGDALGCYVFEREREFELIALPEALDAAWGYEPATPFIGSAA